MDTDQSPPPYELTFENRDTYLYAHVAGLHDTYEICSAYWNEIANQLRQLRLKKVLVIEDIVEESSVADVYRLVSSFVDMGFRGVKIAFVDRYSNHQDLNDFGVLVASNRGLLGKAFINEEAATKWLLGDRES